MEGWKDRCIPIGDTHIYTVDTVTLQKFTATAVTHLGTSFKSFKKNIIFDALYLSATFLYLKAPPCSFPTL